MAAKTEEEKAPQKIFIAVLQTIMGGLILYFTTSFFNERKEQDKELKDITRYIERNKYENEIKDRKDTDQDRRIERLEERIRRKNTENDD